MSKELRFDCEAGVGARAGRGSFGEGVRGWTEEHARAFRLSRDGRQDVANRRVTNMVTGLAGMGKDVSALEPGLSGVNPEAAISAGLTRKGR